MTNGENQPTEQERRESLDRQRDVSMQNLGQENLVNIGAYGVADAEGAGYGDTVLQAMDTYLYQSALDSGIKAYDQDGEYDVVTRSLIGSRTGGNRLSGTITERQIVQKASDIGKESLATVKVSDVMQLAGSEVTVNADLADKYVIELLARNAGREANELGQAIMAGYTQYVTGTGVAEAMTRQSQSVVQGLEQLVGVPQETGEQRQDNGVRRPQATPA